MTNRVASAIASGDAVSAVSQAADSIDQQLAANPPKLIIAFASTRQPLSQVAPILHQRYGKSAVVLGASTAGEFTQAGDQKNALALFALSGDVKVFAGMSTGQKENADAAAAHAMHDLPQEVAGYPHRTSLLLLDPLSGNGEESTMCVALRLSGTARLAGGAAGDDLHMKETTVSCGARVESNALVVASIFSKNPMGIGISHGHVPISGAMRVTKAEGGRVIEIDGRRAWDVWAEKTREAAARVGLNPDQLRDDEVGAYLLRFEAGLPTGAGDGFKIRAPLSKNADGSLNFACAVPEGASFHITESVPQRQVDSAVAAARKAKEALAGAKVAGALVFDCICRNLILGDKFSSAVVQMSEALGGAPLAGFETYGEIALDESSMSGFHNTTTVVLAFAE